jgi:hypothetical protein
MMPTRNTNPAKRVRAWALTCRTILLLPYGGFRQ